MILTFWLGVAFQINGKKHIFIHFEVKCGIVGMWDYLTILIREKEDKKVSFEFNHNARDMVTFLVGMWDLVKILVGMRDMVTFLAGMRELVKIIVGMQDTLKILMGMRDQMQLKIILI